MSLRATAIASFLALSAAPAWGGCGDMLAHRDANAPTRDVTARDLIGLRDIGQPDPAVYGGQSPLALSPDGRSIAFMVSRADADANATCRALVVVSLDKGVTPRIIDRGGEPITVTDIKRGFMVPGGFPEVVVPAWSQDARWIIFLKRVGGITQLWRARADGSGAAPITNSPVDVERWTWDRGRRHLIFTSRPATLALERGQESEGRRGYLYDARIDPNTSVRPQLPASIPVEAFSVESETGEVRPASAAEQGQLSGAPIPGVPLDPVAISADGRRAWTERTSSSPLAPSRIWATDLTGARIPCPVAACKGGIVNLWWDGDKRSLLFLRREGWNRGEMALYRWIAGSLESTRIVSSRYWLIGCVQAAGRLICLGENAVTPRRILSIDTRTGRTETLFNPNPSFTDAIRLGPVRRLTWRNDRGLPAWGDLVLPPAHKHGNKLPLVVVQYRSEGFLRGGTGDDYPIHLLAAHGIAVLSTQRPPHVATALPNLKSYDEINAAGLRGWSERKSLYSSVMAGIDQVIALGIADPTRIGISGLSDGSTTLEYALVNSRRFAAAATSTCCTDPKTVMTYGGIAWADWNREVMGYPPATQDDRAFWKPQSLALNAEHINTPLLMQLADSEYILALEGFTALREFGKPVEMYVYPDEYHYKWQPAHRLAVYERNVDWFDFWLRGRKDSDPAKAAQYGRWEAMRSKRPPDAAEKPAASP